MDTLKALVVGIVIAALAWFLANLLLGSVTDEQVATFTAAIEFVSLVIGFIALFTGIGAWVIKAFGTAGGFTGLSVQETATPAALTIAGAILLAV